MRCVHVLALFVLIACQSEQEGVTLLCESAERCTECRARTVDDAVEAHWRWMDENVKAGPAREIVRGLAEGWSTAAGEMVREASDRRRLEQIRIVSKETVQRPCRRLGRRLP